MSAVLFVYKSIHCGLRQFAMDNTNMKRGLISIQVRGSLGTIIGRTTCEPDHRTRS